MLRAAFTLSLSALALLSGCHRDAPEDPAIAAPGAGIPMGAVGAVGASFDAQAPAAMPPIPSRKGPKSKGPKPPPLPEGEPAPIDPFATPPEPPPMGPAIPKTKTPAPKGTAL